jgi:hypothetical protein
MAFYLLFSLYFPSYPLKSRGILSQIEIRSPDDLREQLTFVLGAVSPTYIISQVLSTWKYTKQKSITKLKKGLGWGVKRFSLKGNKT